jgi:cyclophilin family peptidyl-prolyl cis-trans isomerase
MLRSARTTLFLTLACAALVAHTARAADLLGLSIGVAGYTDTDIVSAPSASADATAVHEALVAMADGGDGAGLTLLATSAEDGSPGRQAVLSSLASIAAHDASVDMAVVYFAGQVMSVEGQAYLLTADTRLDDLAGTAVPLSAVGSALVTARAQRKLLVLAGSTGAASPDDTFYEALVQMRDVTVIVACGPGEGIAAMADGSDAFTHFFVESLAAAEGVPTLRKLAYSAWDTTQRWAVGNGAKQTPQYMPAGRGAPTEESAPDELVVMDTTKGRIVIRLYPEDAPEHVANFKKLVRDGFYDGEAGYFHRYVKNFVIQGGDPQRTGMGGPGYTVPAEIGRKHLKGAVAAARTGDRGNPDRRSSGSQFYICLKRLFQLDRKYSVFGQVIEGMDAVSELRIGDEIDQARVVLASEYTPDE